MSAKKKTISRVLALVLIVSLIVPALLVMPALASTTYYIYGELELPDINSVWTDKETYLYAYITDSSPTYLYLGSHCSGTYISQDDLDFTIYEPYCVYKLSEMGDSWEFVKSGTTNAIMSGYPIWSTRNVSYYKSSSGSWISFLTASDPVPIVSYPSSAELPSFSKNLTGATHYYLQGVTADSLVVEAVVNDGGTIEYEWRLSGDLSGMVYGRGASFVPPTDVPGEYQYVCIARNKVYNPNVEGEYIYSIDAYSFSDTVVVVASSTDSDDVTTPTTPDDSDQFDDLQNSLDEMPDKITDGMQDIMEQEKEQATQQGGQFVDDLTGVVPNDSQGFIDALGSLVSVLSYDGTECVLPVPALTLPAIGGLFPSYTVMEAQEVDFEEFFAMMPPAIMLLVQSLLTVALIVYCFKELYDTVAYFFVLKGGNK